MAESAIEWTDATWNPVTGCSKVSPGCAHCYAESLTRRFAKTWGVPDLPWTPGNAAENVILHPERLDQPLRWRRPRMVFVNSMSDLFHEEVPSSFINDVWMAMYNTPRHTYQVLTKRPERLLSWTHGAAAAKGWPVEEIWPPWVWLGVSIENRRFVHRADLLRQTPAAVRFISAEPLLAPLTTDRTVNVVTGYGLEAVRGWPSGNAAYIPSLDLRGIDWLIVGGESGRGARRFDPQWARELRDECAASGTAFFVKQLGGLRPGTKLEDLPEDLRIRQYPRTPTPSIAPSVQ